MQRWDLENDDNNPYKLDPFEQQVMQQTPASLPTAPDMPAGGYTGPGTDPNQPWNPGNNYAWDPVANHPPGMHWDESMANYVADAPAEQPVQQQQQQQQQIQYAPPQAPAPAAQAPAPRAPAAYTVGEGVPGQGTVFGASNPLTADQNALFAMLMGRARQSLDVNPDDPIISRQTGAFSAQQQRAQRDYEARLAESAGPNTNIGAERRFGAERTGQNTSAFQAGLMGQELAARRNEIAGALQGAQGMLTSEQQMRLQEELAQLSLAQSAYQFDTNQQYLNSPLGS